MKNATAFCVLTVLITLYCSLVDGNKCYRTGIRYTRQKVCCGWDWGNCMVWEYRTITNYIRESYCCPGYTGWNCNTPFKLFRDLPPLWVEE